MACREETGWKRDTCCGLSAPVFGDYLGVDRVSEFLAPRVTTNLGSGDARRPVRRFPGGARYVRREHQVRDLEEFGACGRGFFVLDIERGGPEMPRLQGVAQGFVVEEAAAGGVDQYRAPGHPGYLRGPDHPPRLVGETRVKAYDPGASQQLVQSGLPGSDLFHPLIPDERIVDEDRGPERPEDLSDPATDGPEADEADGGAVELHPVLLVGVEISPPSPLSEGGVGVGDTFHGGEHEAEGVLGGGWCVASWRVGDDHTVLGGGVYVHVNRPPARHDDEPEALEGVEDLLRDRGELGYDHLGTLAPRDDLLLAAGRLFDLGHAYVWLHRPVEVYGDDLGVAPQLSFQRLD